MNRSLADARPGALTAEREWGFSFRRVGAIVLRHYYLLRSSWARVLELAYWPIINMTLWGFMTVFLVGQSSLFAQATGLLLARRRRDHETKAIGALTQKPEGA